VRKVVLAVDGQVDRIRLVICVRGAKRENKARHVPIRDVEDRRHDAVFAPLQTQSRLTSLLWSITSHRLRSQSRWYERHHGYSWCGPQAERNDGKRSSLSLPKPCI